MASAIKKRRPGERGPGAAQRGQDSGRWICFNPRSH